MTNETFEYNLKYAVITGIILTVGGILIFAVNSKDVITPNWDGFLFVVVPCLWILSFIPLLFCKIVNKIKNNNSSAE